jgi:hypothetical protein
VSVHKRMFFRGARAGGRVGINSVWRAFALE